MPCVCVLNYQIYLASAEVVCFIACLVAFIVATCKRGKRIDLVTSFLIFLFLLAFTLHIWFIFYVHSGKVGCQRIQPMTSYFCFAPTGIFFLVFIWVIFKLLVIWRVMVSNTHN